MLQWFMLLKLFQEEFRKEKNMRISNLENVSNERVNIELTDGTNISLPPKGKLGSFDVKNLSEIRSKVKVTENLTEVNAPSGKTKLYD